MCLDNYKLNKSRHETTTTALNCIINTSTSLRNKTSKVLIKQNSTN